MSEHFLNGTQPLPSLSTGTCSEQIDGFRPCTSVTEASDLDKKSGGNSDDEIKRTYQVHLSRCSSADGKGNDWRSHTDQQHGCRGHRSLSRFAINSRAYERNIKLTKTPICIQGSTPVHSKTTSKPSGSPNCANAGAMESLARLTEDCFSSCSVAGGGEGAGRCRHQMSSTHPFSFANSSRFWSISTAHTFRAPRCFASAQAKMPIVPTPKTRTLFSAFGLETIEASLSVMQGALVVRV